MTIIFTYLSILYSVLLIFDCSITQYVFLFSNDTNMSLISYKIIKMLKSPPFAKELLALAKELFEYRPSSESNRLFRLNLSSVKLTCQQILNVGVIEKQKNIIMSNRTIKYQKCRIPELYLHFCFKHFCL